MLIVYFQTKMMIEVTCNDRLGKKVRVKCKYPLQQFSLKEFYMLLRSISFVYIWTIWPWYYYYMGKETI